MLLIILVILVIIFLGIIILSTTIMFNKLIKLNKDMSSELNKINNLILK